jgi:phosphatidylserine decarboxylase
MSNDQQKPDVIVNVKKPKSSSGFTNIVSVLCKTAYNFVAGMLKKTNREGYIFVFISLCITIFVSFASSFFGLFFFGITVWVVAFFRDPERATPPGANLVVSSADGLVSDVKITKMPKELNLGDDDVYKISVFLSVFDVHVNRVPVSGIINKIAYHPGKFLSAELDKSSEENERNALLITNSYDGKHIAVVQIAGMIARRIVCWSKEGNNIKTADRFGLIRFGSRVDVYVPKTYNILVQKGQKVVGGETILALADGTMPHFEIQDESSQSLVD